jgi:Protein of unknown function (DUF3892)
MTTEYRIYCVTKGRNGNINKIGIYREGIDKHEFLSVEQAINDIRNNYKSFYILKGSRKVYVKAITEIDSNSYLRSEGDDETDNNLGELADCEKSPIDVIWGRD